MTNLGFYLTSGSRTHVRFSFATFAAAGANVAPNSAFEAADIRIYKATDGAAISATQRSSANGITMTSPLDSLTGVHSVDIDLTDNTDAGFYAAGCYYEVWLCPDETVDSQTLTGVPLACFEVGVPTANVTQLAGVTQSLTDLKDFADDGYDPSTNKVQGVVLVDTTTDVTTKTGYRLSATGVDDILDEVVQGTATVRQLLGWMGASTQGVSSGYGTGTVTFYYNDGTTAALIVTIVAGNRTATTRA